MDDDERMRQAAAGNTEVFGEIVKAHQERLARFAERLLGDADAAQDVAQETFLRLWHARSRYQGAGCLSSYLLRIARNLCLDRLRAVSGGASPSVAAETPAPPGARPEARLQAKALSEAVRAAVLALPEAQRTVFVLSQYEGLGYREIAAVLDCPLGTVASRKHLAVETLRRRLRPWIENEEKR